MLVFALPADPDGGLDHELLSRFDRGANALEITLTHCASRSRFIVRLPGVHRLDPFAVAVLSLTEARALAPDVTIADRPLPARQRPEGTPSGQMAFVHRHDWRRDGPPQETFFDLSDPESELEITLDPSGGGPVYVVQLTEHSPPRGAAAGNGSTSDRHRSIVLVQAAPNTPALTPALVSQWFETRLGSEDFRSIAWIWLGNEGHFTDPKTGRRRAFGQINEYPKLALHGPLAGSAAIER